MNTKSVEIVVNGRVQGVFYRASTLQKATAIGLSGWVRNLPSGQVLIQACGAEAEISELVAWCKIGPPMAVVDGVEVREIAPQDFSGFQVLR